MLILSRLWFRETTLSNRLQCNLRFVRQAELDHRCFTVVLLLTSLSDDIFIAQPADFRTNSATKALFSFGNPSDELVHAYHPALSETNGRNFTWSTNFAGSFTNRVWISRARRFSFFSGVSARSNSLQTPQFWKAVFEEGKKTSRETKCQKLAIDACISLQTDVDKGFIVCPYI